MAENSSIEWTHHTFQSWWGCQKVSPGCANCYAEAMDKRTLGGGIHWGPNSERRMMSESYWAQPRKWDKAAAAAGERHRVFCSSMADVFEERDDLVGARARLFGLINDTPNLDWLLLTKRPENANRLWRSAAIDAFGNWTDSMTGPAWADNIWLGTTVENQLYAENRIVHLLMIPAAVRFLSCEPLLGPIDLTRVRGILGCSDGRKWEVDVLSGGSWTPPPWGFVGHSDMPKIHWVIAGGESGGGSRPMHADWARSLRDQCAASGTPFLFKQNGEYIQIGKDSMGAGVITGKAAKVDGKKRTLVREDGTVFARLGKKKAGRMLDGKIHDAYPTPNLDDREIWPGDG